MKTSYLAPAKINLYLGVHTQLDQRGYHLVDSVMAQLGLADVVHVQPAEKLSVTFEPQVSVPAHKTAVWRAADALGRAFNRELAFSFTIERNVPVCAGLGGASSDAAAVILALCDAWSLDPHSEQVQAVARSIGADVPFFLYGGIVHLVGGGDVMAERFDPLKGTPVVLVRAPGEGVSTPAAYAEFDRTHPEAAAIDPLLEALRRQDLSAVKANLSNNLWPVARTLNAECAEVQAWLSAQDGVDVAMLTGSGSAVFGLCENDGAAQQVAAAAEQRGWWACATALEASLLRPTLANTH